MLGTKYNGLLVFSAFGAAVDYLIFPLFPATAFGIHHTLALFVGAGMIWTSLRLIQKRSGDNPYHSLSIFVGLTMIVVHSAKLLGSGVRDIRLFIRTYFTGALYTVVYKGDYFFIDYWSFDHFFSGLLIVLIVCSKQYSRPFFLLACSLFGWELLEISFLYFALNLFRPETLPDQLTDIVIGFAGGGMGWLIWTCKQRRSLDKCRSRVWSLLVRLRALARTNGKASDESAMIKRQDTNNNPSAN